MGSFTVPAMYPRGMESNGTFFFFFPSQRDACVNSQVFQKQVFSTDPADELRDGTRKRVESLLTKHPPLIPSFFTVLCLLRLYSWKMCTALIAMTML